MLTQKKVIESVLCNRIKEITDKDQTYTGSPMKLVEEINKEVTKFNKKKK